MGYLAMRNDFSLPRFYNMNYAIYQQKETRGERLADRRKKVFSSYPGFVAQATQSVSERITEVTHRQGKKNFSSHPGFPIHTAQSVCVTRVSPSTQL